MKRVELHNLRKAFGDTVAVENLTLTLDEGVFFTFLGPNGAGKTTTMKLMAGLLRPTAGTVFIDGLNVAEQPEAVKSRIGYIPDHPYLYGKLTGWEFLRFIGGLYEMSEGDVRDRGDELLDVFELHEQSSRLIETYSHGMRQRLAFTACFLHRPRVVIIDEPWVGLDPRNIRSAINEWPPRSKKSSWRPMRECAISDDQIAANVVSTSPRGGANAVAIPASPGAGNAVRSILPFGVCGSASSTTNEEG